jgi:hypothetical protein
VSSHSSIGLWEAGSETFFSSAHTKLVNVGTPDKLSPPLVKIQTLPPMRCYRPDISMSTVPNVLRDRTISHTFTVSHGRTSSVIIQGWVSKTAFIKKIHAERRTLRKLPHAHIGNYHMHISAITTCTYRQLPHAHNGNYHMRITTIHRHKLQAVISIFYDAWRVSVSCKLFVTPALTCVNTYC